MIHFKLLLTVVLVMCFISTVSFAQEKNMMKDTSKMDMMKKDEMRKDMRDIRMMKDEMPDKEMKHDKMMKIDKNADGVAIKGYDPVAYFTDDRARMGNSEYSYNWMAANWHFVNEEHLNMFKEDPEKYAPKYGGYCAYGVGAANTLISTDPTAWTIEDGDLYLNKNADVGKLFRKDLRGNIMNAEKNWPGLNKNDEM